MPDANAPIINPLRAAIILTHPRDFEMKNLQPGDRINIQIESWRTAYLPDGSTVTTTRTINAPLTTELLADLRAITTPSATDSRATRHAKERVRDAMRESEAAHG